jgi:hypothetical protein
MAFPEASKRNVSRKQKERYGFHSADNPYPQRFGVNLI